MKESSKGIWVGCEEHRVYIRVAGRGTFQNSQPLRLFALQKIDEGEREFIIDLGQCRGMDSTFLGVLAGIGLRLRQDGKAATVHVASINSRNLESIQTLGLDRLFAINPSELPSLGEADYHKLPETDIGELAHPLDKEETADLMIEAHDNLVRADERNAPKFQELTRCLRDAMERRRQEQEEAR
ncbi:MAG TPA: STAS domain-containing protein [Verrucomicrobiae bacterium]|nr:STAS domain-containing protein [Verrucomicrobiae bacterium]